MNCNRYPCIALFAASVLLPAVAMAQPDSATNRLTFSMRYGVNLSARFSSTTPIAVPLPARTTPNGAPYNYNNGYVLTDISGSPDGLTWYWGYDNSSSQVNAGAHTIQFERSTGPANLLSPEMKEDSAPGGEIAYAHELGSSGHFHWGFEAAANYSNMRFNSHSSYSLRGPTSTDAYPYVPGTTPPVATPGIPYQGTFEGPGFVIGTTPASSTPTESVVGNVSGDQSIEADLWSGRAGMYLEYYPADWLSVGVSAGLAGGWVDTTASWNQAISFTNGGAPVAQAGNGSYTQWLGGFYAGANLNWRLTDHCYASGGVQYQNLGTHDHTVGVRNVELNLSQSVFVTFGLSFSF
jgi:hypothetical protein